jgi:hypothetical protein
MATVLLMAGNALKGGCRNDGKHKTCGSELAREEAVAVERDVD